MNHFDKIALALPAAGLDGVLLTGEYNRFYASGFATTGTDGVALVTTEGNFYFTDSRYIEAAENTVENAAIGLADREKGYVAWLGEALALTGARRIGFEDETMTVAEHRLYSEKLQAELVPASAFLRELRAQKDPEELERMEQAQRIAEKALGQILAEIRPGVTEKEIAARLQYLMLHFGAERMSFDPIVASGPNGSMPHAVPTERKIQTGEFVTMDFGCVYKSYCSDMTRTVCVGRPTEEMERVYETVLRAQLTGIAAARAGATGAQIDGAAEKSSGGRDTLNTSAMPSATAWGRRSTKAPTLPREMTSPCLWAVSSPPSRGSICPGALACALRMCWCWRRADAGI